MMIPFGTDALGLFPHQDFIVLAGAQSPGKAVPKGAGSPRDWDIRKGYGLSGAGVVFTGENLTKFDVDIFLWDETQFVAWEIFAQLTLVNPPLGVRPTSMSIQHPILNMRPLSITQVVVEDVTQWECNDDGLWACTIKFIKYRPPKPALLKPFEGPPGAPEAVAPPQSPEEATIQRLTAQVVTLSGS
jgi:hypothetical protein